LFGQVSDLGLQRFVADNLISLNQGGDANLVVVFVRDLFDSNDFSDGPDEHFRAAGDFSGQRHSQIQLGASGEVITDVKIDSASGYVASLSVTGVLFNRQLNQDR